MASGCKKRRLDALNCWASAFGAGFVALNSSVRRDIVLFAKDREPIIWREWEKSNTGQRSRRYKHTEMLTWLQRRT